MDASVQAMILTSYDDEALFAQHQWATDNLTPFHDSGTHIQDRGAMNENNLHEHAQALLTSARTAHAGRAAHRLVGGPDTTMTQTVIALRGGASLAEHENPGEASVLVLQGHVRLHAHDEAWDGTVGDLLVVPPRKHGLDATTDAVVLLTAVKDDETLLTARTYSEFPGPHGRVYRALVLGTRAHVVATRHMLHSVRSLSLD